MPLFSCYLSYSKTLIFYYGKWYGKFHNQLKLLRFGLKYRCTDYGSWRNAIEVVGAKFRPPSEHWKFMPPLRYSVLPPLTKNPGYVAVYKECKSYMLLGKIIQCKIRIKYRKWIFNIILKTLMKNMKQNTVLQSCWIWCWIWWIHGSGVHSSVMYCFLCHWLQ